jgi:hypothetical protein
VLPVVASDLSGAWSFVNYLRNNRILGSIRHLTGS